MKHLALVLAAAATCFLLVVAAAAFTEKDLDASLIALGILNTALIVGVVEFGWHAKRTRRGTAERIDDSST